MPSTSAAVVQVIKASTVEDKPRPPPQLTPAVVVAAVIPNKAISKKKRMEAELKRLNTFNPGPKMAAVRPPRPKNKRQLAEINRLSFSKPGPKMAAVTIPLPESVTIKTFSRKGTKIIDHETGSGSDTADVAIVTPQTPVDPPAPILEAVIPTDNQTCPETAAVAETVTEATATAPESDDDVVIIEDDDIAIIEEKDIAIVQQEGIAVAQEEGMDITIVSVTGATSPNEKTNVCRSSTFSLVVFISCPY